MPRRMPSHHSHRRARGHRQAWRSRGKAFLPLLLPHQHPLLLARGTPLYLARLWTLPVRGGSHPFSSAGQEEQERKSRRIPAGDHRFT